ncbi:hypothetical protein ACWDOR_45800, partial [Streptosporangium canum]
ANNQLAHPGVEKELADRGILYAPDYVVNSGRSTARAARDGRGTALYGKAGRALYGPRRAGRARDGAVRKGGTGALRPAPRCTGAVRKGGTGAIREG